eukprot:CAMPEP_0198238794 /NCGR_PEP_ID=MMETSP1446-20131203/4347_1 /TAXON_ID=1461542 ORGANISM="Unidentified sp, Strain CCMP2111" /NCGR_SAMPLE_ID=MMETSP1446 /ASSEMBLY_ACC=CAM_ASM_001112 /LENGTH=118 /DNA_ID=CAMNT_0043921261 /DNA_START=359 /DNA_END=716 /DNA_ORIENTATION=+
MRQTRYRVEVQTRLGVAAFVATALIAVVPPRFSQHERFKGCDDVPAVGDVKRDDLRDEGIARVLLQRHEVVVQGPIRYQKLGDVSKSIDARGRAPANDGRARDKKVNDDAADAAGGMK